MDRSTSVTSWSTSRPISGCGSSALQGTRSTWMGADDAHGAPIMLKAEAEGITPEELVARIAAGRPRSLNGFLLSFDHWHSTHSPENIELSQEIYRALKANEPDLPRAGGAVLRSGEEHVPGRSLHQRRVPDTATPRISTATPARSAARCTRPPSSINPYSTLSGAKPVLKTSDHFFFKLSDPRCVEFLAEWTRTQALAAVRWRTRPASGSSGKGDAGAGRLGHLARRALLRHSDSRRAGQIFLCVAGCAGRLSRGAEELFRPPARRRPTARRAASSSSSTADDVAADSFHRQGHHLFPHAVLAGDAEVRGPQGAGQRLTCTASSPCPALKMSKSRGTGLSPVRYLGSRHESRVAALLPRRQAATRTSKTSTSTPMISSRA